jgi:hypothetical protein
MKLVAERAKYETFLRELEKDGASKPANVVARVRADYSARLEGVVEQLKTNHDVLTQHAASLTTQLQKLQEAEQRLHDEIAELDIRKQVGEIPEEEWASSVERVRSDAAKLKSQQEVTSGDINRIREMLSNVASATHGDAAAPAVPAPPVDELAFLKAVVGPTTGQNPAVPQRKSAAKTPKSTMATPPDTAARKSTIKPIGPPPRPSSTTAPRASTTAKPVEPLIEPDPMSVESTPRSEAITRPVKRQTPTKEALIEQPQSELTIVSKTGDERPLASNVPTGELNLKSMGLPGATKKAKCPKCGGLNVPSDWYCVHCGGELAI